MDGFAEDTFLRSSTKEGTGYIGPLREGDNQVTIVEKLEAYRKVTAQRHANLKRIDRFADVIINSPSHGQHHTRPFVQRTIIGIPYLPDHGLISQITTGNKDGEINILHCPSYPEGKGTPEIRQAIELLKSEGHPINYIEVTGRPNQEVLELITQCDFVIDQLYSDMAMVGFATEAAFFGKPAIVGGYYTINQASDLDQEWIPPTLFCSPQEIKVAIENLVIDIEFREKLGARAKEFVEKNWVASECAKRIIALASGTFPTEWLYDPQNCDYILGMGLSKKHLHRIYNGLINTYGIDVFLFNDKPKMEQKIRKFAEKAYPDQAKIHSVKKEGTTK